MYAGWQILGAFYLEVIMGYLLLVIGYLLLVSGNK